MNDDDDDGRKTRARPFVVDEHPSRAACLRARAPKFAASKSSSRKLWLTLIRENERTQVGTAIPPPAPPPGIRLFHRYFMRLLSRPSYIIPITHGAIPGERVAAHRLPLRLRRWHRRRRRRRSISVSPPKAKAKEGEVDLCAFCTAGWLAGRRKGQVDALIYHRDHLLETSPRGDVHPVVSSRFAARRCMSTKMALNQPRYSCLRR